jgi:hypothetical protein
LEDAELNKALGPYKVEDRGEHYIVLRYSQSLYRNIYIYTAVWVFIAIILGKAVLTLPATAFLIFAFMYFPFCFLFRYIAIKNPIFVSAEQDELKLKYKNYFGGEREINYSSQELESVEPYQMVSKQTWVTSIRINISNKRSEQIFFSSGEKKIAVQRSKDLALLFSEILGIKLLNYS